MACSSSAEGMNSKCYHSNMTDDASAADSMTRDCRPFPSYEHGDCEEEGFCELWRAAAAGMVIAAVIGGLTIVALLATMCSQRRKRSKAWAPISLLAILKDTSYSRRETN
ncbi:hypothetical protein MBANPS3_010267 [Mucor bainieri]